MKVNSSSKRLVGLDLMRAVAILLVLYSHGIFLFYPYIYAPFANITFSLFGFFGVEIFFVLSGYLIGKIFIELFYEKNSFNLSSLLRFWLRRWFRTFPNYYLMLTVLLFIGVLKNELPPTEQIIQYIFFAQNLYTFNPIFFLQAWSLSVEEWFYFIFPLLTIFSVFLLSSIRNYVFLAVPIFVILICNMARIKGFYEGIPLRELEHMTIFRLDSIIYGVLIAFLYSRWAFRMHKLRNALMIVGISILIFIIFIQIRFILIASPIERIGLVIISMTPIAFSFLLPFFKGLQWSSETGFGKTVSHISLISYSLYLNHFILVLALGDYFKPETFLEGILVFALFLVVSIGISTLQYQFWEKYFLRLRDKWWPS